MPSRDAPIAMVLQHLAEGEPGLSTHDMLHPGVGANDMCMFVGDFHHTRPPPFCPQKRNIVHKPLSMRIEQGETLCKIASATTSRGKEQKLAQIVQFVGGRRLHAPQPSPRRRRDDAIAPMVWAEGDLREGQISLARAMGDEPLIASQRSLETGGRESAELNKNGILGQDAGTGSRARNLIESEPRSSDATMNVMPTKPKKVFSGSTLKLRNKKKTRAGNHGPEIATTE